ncbi:spore germination protein [Alkalihalobacillus hwajinpoensis]|nr:spore germination protein [Pseudalkalibacillus hwajinpoensis]
MRRSKRKSIRNESYQIPTATESHDAYYSLEENKEYIKSKFHNTEDIKFRNITVQDVKCLLTYLDPLVDEKKLQNTIMKPLFETNQLNIEDTVTSKEYRRSKNLNDAVSGLTKGFVVLLMNGY